MLNLLWYEVRSRLSTIIWWSIGLTLFGLMYTLIYPEIEEQMAALGDLSVYQAMGVEVDTFDGYFASTVVGIMPILLGVYAVLTGTNTLAGEEDNGTLELILTTRLPRWQVVFAKGEGLLIVTGLIMVLSGIGTMLGFNMVKDQITTSVTSSEVFVFVLSTLPLIWAILMISFFFGTFFPSRKSAMLAGFLVLITAYFGENIGNTVESMEWLKPFSLFSYFDSSSAVFRDGIAFSDVAVLLVVTLIAFALAIVFFQRRDVTVGNWPWQRVRMSG